MTKPNGEEGTEPAPAPPSENIDADPVVRTKSDWNKVLQPEPHSIMTHSAGFRQLDLV